MELSEATALAGTFITAMFFRVWSLPLHKSSKRAAEWWKSQGSALPAAEALEENRRHLRHFAARETIDRAKGRSLHLTISALTIDREAGRCPALQGGLCGIYESRPLSCRTVPLHYAKPLSLLGSALDKFTRTPDYLCDVSPDAPIVLDAAGVTEASVQQARADALKAAEVDRCWKNEIVSLMDDAYAAPSAGLPTYGDVLKNSDAGFGSSVSMLVAWRIARGAGLMTQQTFRDVCERQIRLLNEELARAADLNLAARLAGTLSAYEAERAKFGRSDL